MVNEIKGLKELLLSFKELGHTFDEKEVKPLMIKEGNKIAATMRSLVRDRTGRLERSIKVVKPNKFPFTIIVGPDYTPDGKGTLTIPALASINEFGASERRPKNGKFLQFRDESGGWVRVKVAKAIPAHPFIRPAHDMNKGSAIKNLREGLIKLVENKATKLNLK